MQRLPHSPTLSSLLLTALVALGCAVPAAGDEVQLKNGDRYTGKIETMSGGNLVMVTEASGKITIKWAEVVRVRTDAPLPLLLDDDTKLVGELAIYEPEDGFAAIRTEKMQGRIRLGDVTSINPPVKQAVEFSGFIRAGGVVTDGNTRTREANAAAEVTARSERLRLLLRGQWNYGEDRNQNDLFKRNTLAEIKMDFFVLTKLFLYANTLFQSDLFQDLSLRTALGAGAGYQWVEEPNIKIFTEAGLSYVVDDRRRGEDSNTLAARMAWKINWDIISNLSFFHQGEIFPSVEDPEDFFLNTSTGIKLSVVSGLFVSWQIDFRYDNTPSPGFGRRDTSYIFSVGYSF